MNFKRKTSLIAMTIIIIISFIGCGNKTMDKVYNDNSKIAKEYDTFGVNTSKETAEKGRYKGDLSLSGSGTIWKYESNEDIELKVPYSLSVKDGKAKIVLISPDNTVSTLVENTGKASTDEKATLTVPIKKGINRIKLVGYEKAKINVELNIDKGRFQQIS